MEEPEEEAEIEQPVSARKTGEQEGPKAKRKSFQVEGRPSCVTGTGKSRSKCQPPA